MHLFGCTIRLCQHNLYTERNLITLVSYLQRYAESLRKSKKMPAQLGLTVDPGMTLNGNIYLTVLFTTHLLLSLWRL